MGVFYHEEPQNNTKRCKYLATTLKEVFYNCQTSGRQLSTASLEEEFPISDLDEEEEVVVSTVRSRAAERQKHKSSLLRESFSWVYSPATRELYVTQTITPPAAKEGCGDEQHDEREEEFMSVKSCISCCSSTNAVSDNEAFHSVRTNLSRCSSMNEVDLPEYWRRSIIQEFCHCEGWPFGLCRKAVLLPPLPKSPSESWLSRKIQRSPKDT